MNLPFCLVLFLLSALLGSATTTPSRTVAKKRWSKSASSPFVTANNGQFQVNGSDFKFIGTNAYWLQSLNTEQDIINTLSNISAANISVVRTWAFNDVNSIPENGTWLQLISNGTQTINNGTNGLQKLDLLVKHAQNMGIYLLFSLTNNWNPDPLLDNLTISVTRRDVTFGTNNTLPRNFLSNDYGGMDLYVRELGMNRQHDEFFTNQTILNFFMNWTTQVVSRYVDSPAIFGWELANDARCNSSLSASPTCTPQTITKWHSTVAQHIASIDPNHLVSSGTQGFFCMGCPKLFPRAAPPPPQASPAPGSARRRALPFTKAKILQDRKEARKKTRAAIKGTTSGGIRIRGNWIATPTRQADTGIGSAFDGSQGVDSEDILGIPEIGFGSFQLFPDQNQYAPFDPLLPAFNNTVNAGLSWIEAHAQISSIFGKPTSLTGFGLVTQNNAPDFVPFNSTIAPFGTSSGSGSNITGSTQPFGVTDQQRDDAYSQWLRAGIENGLQGMIQYQWGQQNLTTQPGTTISPNVNGTTESANANTIGQSPNDGYSTTADVGSESSQDVQSVQSILSNAAQAIAPPT